jgi:hypothetical protein
VASQLQGSSLRAGISTSPPVIKLDQGACYYHPADVTFTAEGASAGGASCFVTDYYTCRENGGRMTFQDFFLGFGRDMGNRSCWAGQGSECRNEPVVFSSAIGAAFTAAQARARCEAQARSAACPGSGIEEVVCGPVTHRVIQATVLNPWTKVVSCSIAVICEDDDDPPPDDPPYGYPAPPYGYPTPPQPPQSPRPTSTPR